MKTSIQQIFNAALLKSKLKTLAIIGFMLVLSSCRDDDPTPIIDAEESPYSSYLQVGKDFYPLKEATAIYGEKDGQTIFSLWLLDGAEDNLVLFDDLLINNSLTLPEGKFSYKKPLHSSEIEVNRFHISSVKFGAVNTKTSLNSFQATSHAGSLTVKKQGNNYVLDGELDYDGQKAIVHYEGAVEYMESW